MKINPVSNRKTFNYNKISILSPCFCGLDNPKTKSLFVFDLDGTLLSTNKQQLDFILKSAKQCNADIVYATGRTLDEFIKLQNKMKQKNIDLVNPDYLIVNNGNFLYENIDGQFIENYDYQKALKNISHYDRKIVTDTIKTLSLKEDYQYTQEELLSLSNFDEIKLHDPEFYNSKIAYYEWNPSKNMAEYFLSHDVDVEKFKNELNSALLKQGINVRYKLKLYSKPIMDACNENILLQSNSLRRHKNGAMTAIFISAGDKGCGIEFIKKQKNINYNNILMAGNDDNDIPMAELSNKGAKFICLNNASFNLKKYCEQLKENVFLSIKDGADAIISGINHFCKI